LTTTYSFTVPEIVGTSVIHLWLGFLVCYGGGDLLDSTLDSSIINSR
jgi:hypothetical protein